MIALATSGLPAHERRNAIAVTAVYLLAIAGLPLVGEMMLGWVCVRMWKELRSRCARP